MHFQFHLMPFLFYILGRREFYPVENFKITSVLLSLIIEWGNLIFMRFVLFFSVSFFKN